jgi:peptide-methionine (S)-S-oxide reductase
MYPNQLKNCLNKFRLFILLGLFACNSGTLQSQKAKPNNTHSNHTIPQAMNQNSNQPIDSCVLAGGCFWCLDAVYRQMNGIINVESGYSNGQIKNPTYKEVCSGRTGHAEVAKIYYNSSITSYQQILEVFWRIHNPTTLNRQGNDIGTQYRSGIYYMNDAQAEIAKASKQAVEQSGLWAADGKVVTEILPLDNYWPAEDYHQDYFANNPENQYCVYVVSEKVEKFKKTFAELLKSK